MKNRPATIKRILLLAICVFHVCGGSYPMLANTPQPDKIKLLIVDGFSNHDWQRTTQLITGILKEYGDITIDVSTSPDSSATKEEMKRWRPDFSAFDVVLLNCNDLGKPVQWSEATKKSLESFVHGGGGLYVFHSANNAFERWDEYNRMIGLGWRKKNFGNSIVIEDDQHMNVIPPGEGEDTSHGRRVNALVTRIGDHPIQKGLPRQWIFADIEIYTYARGSAENLIVLSYARDKKFGLNFPVEWVVKYGQGNVYNSSLGHLWKDQENPVGLRCAAFQTEMHRAIQWLAKRQVDTVMPDDFPGTKAVSLRDNTNR